MKADDTAKILGILATMQNQFSSMQNQFSDIQQQFATMQRQMSGLESRFDGLEADMHDGFETIGQQIDAIMGVYERDDIERVALSTQVDRHDNWIKKAAPKVKVKYSEIN